MEEQILEVIGRKWRSESVKQTLMAKHDKRWNREKQVKDSLRILQSFIPELIEKKKSYSFIDVFPETGVMLEVVQSLGHSIQGMAPTKSPFKLMFQSQQVPMVYHDLDKEKDELFTLPFSDKTFDFLLCLSGLSYISTRTWQPLLREFVRISKKAIVVGFVYDGYYQAFGHEVRDYDVGFKLTKVNTTVLRWDYKK
jgi:hypothetical protein